MQWTFKKTVEIPFSSIFPTSSNILSKFLVNKSTWSCFLVLSQKPSPGLWDSAQSPGSQTARKPNRWMDLLELKALKGFSLLDAASLKQALQEIKATHLKWFAKKNSPSARRTGWDADFVGAEVCLRKKCASYLVVCPGRISSQKKSLFKPKLLCCYLQCFFQGTFRNLVGLESPKALSVTVRWSLRCKRWPFVPNSRPPTGSESKSQILLLATSSRPEFKNAPKASEFGSKKRLSNNLDTRGVDDFLF